MKYYFYNPNSTSETVFQRPVASSLFDGQHWRGLQVGFVWCRFEHRYPQFTYIAEVDNTEECPRTLIDPVTDLSVPIFEKTRLSCALLPDAIQT